MDGRTVNACALLTAAVNCAPAGHLPLEGKAAILEYHLLKKGGEAATSALNLEPRTLNPQPSTLNPEPNESVVKRGCEEMRIHFFTAPFVFISSYDSHTDHRRQHFHRSDSVSPDDGLHSRRR